jgi:glycosyltransferase involved in cell wall biosynthesis
VISSGLKAFARRFFDRVWQFRLASSLSTSGNGQVSLLYAGKADPRTASAGGAVKLRYLSQRFPESNRRGHVLYLVSSALPRGVLGWARAARVNRLKVVLNQNGVAYPAWVSRHEAYFLNRRAKALLRFSDHVIYQSEFCRESCDRWVGKAKAAHSIIYNPVDTSLFHSSGAKREFDLLLSGSCSQPERVRLPLEALALAKKNGLHWRMRIAGRFLWPNAECDFAHWLSDLNISDKVERAGTYSQIEAPEIYRSAKVLVHMQDKDASPTVPLEAMACGLPVIGIASGGMPELITSEVGTLLRVERGWDQFFYPSKSDLFIAIQNELNRSEMISGDCQKHVDLLFKELLGL